MSNFLQTAAQSEFPLVDLRHHPRPGGEFINIGDDVDMYHAPTQDAFELFDPNLNIDRPDLGYRQRFAQTPLCPNRLFTYRQPYPRVIEMLMESRFRKTFEDVGLMEPYAQAIRDEVLVGFERRYEGNTRAYHRLRNAILTETSYSADQQAILLESEDADLIWRALTAGASLHDMGKLLLRYPQMQSAEAAKYTRPFHPMASQDMEKHIYHGLGECMRDSDLDVEVFKRDDERTDIRYIDIMKGAELLEEEQRERRRLIIATKDNIAEMTDGNTIIQLVRKRPFIAIRPDLYLHGVKPNIQDVPIQDPNGNGHVKCSANLQLIGTSCYWRVKPEEDSAPDLSAA